MSSLAAANSSLERTSLDLEEEEDDDEGGGEPGSYREAEDRNAAGIKDGNSHRRFAYSSLSLSLVVPTMASSPLRSTPGTVCAFVYPITPSLTSSSLSLPPSIILHVPTPPSFSSLSGEERERESRRPLNPFPPAAPSPSLSYFPLVFFGLSSASVLVVVVLYSRFWHTCLVAVRVYKYFDNR